LVYKLPAMTNIDISYHEDWGVQQDSSESNKRI